MGCAAAEFGASEEVADNNTRASGPAAAVAVPSLLKDEADNPFRRTAELFSRVDALADPLSARSHGGGRSLAYTRELKETLDCTNGSLAALLAANEEKITLLREEIEGLRRQSEEVLREGEDEDDDAVRTLSGTTCSLFGGE